MIGGHCSYCSPDTLGNHEAGCPCGSPQARWQVGGFVGGPQGWTCPRCERVYAPHVAECTSCNAQVKFEAQWGKNDASRSA